MLRLSSDLSPQILPQCIRRTCRLQLLSGLSSCFCNFDFDEWVKVQAGVEMVGLVQYGIFLVSKALDPNLNMPISTYIFVWISANISIALIGNLQDPSWHWFGSTLCKVYRSRTISGPKLWVQLSVKHCLQLNWDSHGENLLISQKPTQWIFTNETVT